MEENMRLLPRTLLASVLLAILPAAAMAQGAYPTKPVRLIVALPPGGSTDIIARLVGQKLSERVGQQVVVDNRGGAGGTIGTDIAAKSTADGYTLTMGTTSTHVIAPAIFPNVKYDPIKDFEPITLVASTPYLLVLHPGVKAKSLKEFVALVKSQPGKLNYASAGSGTTTQIAMEMLKLAAGIDIVHVPYNGNGPAGTATMGGQVERDRRGNGQAVFRASQRANSCRVGLPRVRSVVVARLLRAEGHARAGVEEALRRTGRDREVAGNEGAFRAQRG